MNYNNIGLGWNNGGGGVKPFRIVPLAAQLS
jgi:hypothetical protein